MIDYFLTVVLNDDILQPNFKVTQDLKFGILVSEVLIHSNLNSSHNFYPDFCQDFLIKETEYNKTATVIFDDCLAEQLRDDDFKKELSKRKEKAR